MTIKIINNMTTKELKEEINGLNGIINDIVIELTSIYDKLDSIECMDKDKDKLSECKKTTKQIIDCLIL